MRFKKIYIEILNTCNLKCPFCIQNSRPASMMNPKQFEHILKQIKPYTQYIYLHILGEPLSHPQFASFLELANQYHIHVNLTTNGTLLAQQLPILLASDALRQVNISIHALPNNPTYLNEVILAADQLSNQGIYVSYRLWQFHNGRLDSSIMETIHILNNHYQTTIIPSCQSFRLKEHCFVSFDEQFEWPTLEHDFISFEGTCLGWRHMAGILCDGTVVPCCLDSKGDIPLGNIFEESFDDIVKRNETLLQEIRNHHFSQPLCQRCSYRQRFDH